MPLSRPNIPAAAGSLLFGLNICLSAQILPSLPPPKQQQIDLWIRIDESGKQNASLGVYREATPTLAHAFVAAVGCKPSDLVDRSRPEVNCLPATTRTSGLKSTIHWPLSRLRTALATAGISTITVYLHHPGNGTAQMNPPMQYSSSNNMFGWSHQSTMPIAALPDISLEIGFEEHAVWLLLAGALVTALSPLLLLPLKRTLPAIEAGIRWTGIVIGSAWLWIILFTDAPGLAALLAATLPGPPNVWISGLLLAPTIVASCLAYNILGPRYRRILPPLQAVARSRLLLSGGLTVSGLLLCFVAFFAGGDRMVPLAAIGLVVFLMGIGQRFWTVRGSAAELSEGQLLDRIRQLASRSGAPVKTVRIIRTDFDTPAAFADHTGGILLSSALLRELSRSEVDAIVAHEMSHIRRNHGAQMRMWLMALPCVLAVSFFVKGFALWAAALLIPGGFLSYMAMRRSQELVADADAAIWSDSPEALIRGLTRATRRSGVPLSWGRVSGLVLPHPPTLERFRALGAASGIPTDRIDAIVASAETAPDARYELPEKVDLPEADIGRQGRARLRLILSWYALVFPVLFSVAAPILTARVDVLSWPILVACELLCGMLFFYLIYEWLAGKSRAQVRDQMRRRLMEENGIQDPGRFAGISPSSQTALYEGMYDFEWGFVAFEGDYLMIRGEHGTFVANRNEISKIWLDPGPPSFTNKPMLSLELRGERDRGFSIRPFDNAFGPLAVSAGYKLQSQAEAWHCAGNSTSSRQPPPIGLPLATSYPEEQGQAEPPHTVGQFCRAVLQFGTYTLGGSGVLQFLVLDDYRPDLLGATLILTAGLVLFLSWPALRQPKH